MRLLICLLGLLFCFSGCDAPMAKNPIGKPWKDAEVSKLDSTWLFSTSGITFAIVGQKDGRAQAAIFDPQVHKNPAENSIRLVRMDCVFTRVGKYEFVFFKAILDKADEEKQDGPNDYLFWLITERDATSMTMAEPTDQFNQLVDSGKLPGKIIKGKRNEYVVIDTDEKTFLEVIESVGVDKCFGRKEIGKAERILPKTKSAGK